MLLGDLAGLDKSQEIIVDLQAGGEAFSSRGRTAEPACATVLGIPSHAVGMHPV